MRFSAFQWLRKRENHHTPDEVDGRVNWRHMFLQRTVLESRWTGSSSRVCRSKYQAHNSTIYATYLHGNIIITGGRDRCIRFWELNTTDCILHQMDEITDAHTASVLCLQVDLEGFEGEGMMVSGCSAGHIKIWNLRGILGVTACFQRRPMLSSTLLGHTSNVTDLILTQATIMSR